MKTRVVFVNAGILGMQTFSKYIREAMAADPALDARHIDLSEQLTWPERAARRVVCAPLWPDGLLGLKNLDLARFRREYSAGWRAARRLAVLRRTFDADVLHFHRQATAYASVRLMRRVPSIVSIDTTQDIVIDLAASALERRTYALNARRDGQIFRAARAIVSTSEWAAGCLRRRYPDCATPVHVMPSPVRLHFFDERWIDRRLERSTPGRLPRVLFVGGDFVRKGGPDLLRAWREAELYKHATLDVVSNWPDIPEDVPGVRIVRGISAYSDDWATLWREADVFVLPTLDEAFGQVFQEAAAAGLPRIGTAINAIPEMVADGRSGLLVPPGDRARLAAALRTLVDSPTLRRDFGRAARVDVTRLASPDDYRARLSALVQSLAPARTGAL